MVRIRAFARISDQRRGHGRRITARGASGIIRDVGCGRVLELVHPLRASAVFTTYASDRSRNEERYSKIPHTTLYSSPSFIGGYWGLKSSIKKVAADANDLQTFLPTFCVKLGRAANIALRD